MSPTSNEQDPLPHGRNIRYNPRKRVYMPKCLIEGSYSVEGLRGLAKYKAFGRRAEVKDASAALGVKLEGICYAAVALAAIATGLIRIKTIHPGFSKLDRFAVRWGSSNL